MDLGQLSVRISASMGDFVRTIGDASRRVRGLTDDLNGGSGRASNSVSRLNSGFKDMDRIVSGILISQLFYGAVSSIKEATSAVIEFSSNMQAAQVSMEYLLGSADKAKGFIEVMKDFAAQTPFSTEQALANSRKLLAMGFEADSLRNVMGIMTDAAAATGATGDQLDRIVLALGQMKTNGFIAGQELRQLAEAGIPAYKIMIDYLGIAQSKVKDIGKMKISGDLGVAAVLKYMEDHYKGAADRIAETMAGMWNTIKDDFLISSQKLFEKPLGALDGFLRKWRDGMEFMRTTLTKSGVGGLFEAIVPPELQTSVKRMILGLKSLGDAFRIVGATMKPIITDVFGSMVIALGKSLPVIGALAKQIALMGQYAVQHIPGIKLLVTAITGLLIANLASKALMFLWSVTRIGVICAAVADAVLALGKAVQFLFIVLTKNAIARVIAVVAAGLIYLAYTSKAAAAWLDALWARVAAFSGINVADMLAPENNKGADEYLADYNKQLEAMQSNLKDVGKDAAASGKKVKDKFVASFDELYQIPDKLDDVSSGLEDVGNVPIPTLPTDVIGGIKPGDWQGPPAPEKEDPWWENIVLPRPKPEPPDGGEGGAGGLIGLPSADRVEKLKAAYQKALDEVSNSLDAVGIHIGALRPVMENFNSGLATMVNKIVEVSAGIGIWSAETSITFGQWVVTNSTALGTWIANTASSFATWIADTSKGFGKWVADISVAFGTWTTGTIVAIGKWASDTSTSIGTWAITTATSIGKWISDTTTGISTWVVDTTTNIGIWTVDTATRFTTWIADTGKNFTAWATNTYNDFVTWSTDTTKNFTTWITSVTKKFIDWGTDTSKNFATWSGNTYDNFVTWGLNTGANFTTWATTTGKTIRTWVSTTADDIYNWGINTGENLAIWATNTLQGIGTWADGASNVFGTWANNTAAGVASWVNSVVGSIANFATSGAAAISAWADGSWNVFSSWLSGTSSAVGGWSKSVIGNIVSWARSAWSVLAGLAAAVGASFRAMDSSVDGALASVGIGAEYKVQNWSAKDKFMTFELPALLAGGLISMGAKASAAAAPIVAPILKKISGFATGGLIDKEQLIRVGERNKAEAVVPLQDARFMRPFSEAVANDLASMMGGSSQGSSEPDMRPILYVGNLIADDKGLKELYRKMQVIGIQEDQRRGLT